MDHNFPAHIIQLSYNYNDVEALSCIHMIVGMSLQVTRSYRRNHGHFQVLSERRKMHTGLQLNDYPILVLRFEPFPNDVIITDRDGEFSVGISILNQHRYHWYPPSGSSGQRDFHLVRSSQQSSPEPWSLLFWLTAHEALLLWSKLSRCCNILVVLRQNWAANFPKLCSDQFDTHIWLCLLRLPLLWKIDTKSIQVFREDPLSVDSQDPIVASLTRAHSLNPCFGHLCGPQ